MERVQRLAPLLPNYSAHTHARKRPRECGSTPVRMNQHAYTQLRVIWRKGQCRGARGAPCVTLVWTTGASLGLCLHLPYVFNRASIDLKEIYYNSAIMWQLKSVIIFQCNHVFWRKSIWHQFYSLCSSCLGCCVSYFCSTFTWTVSEITHYFLYSPQ